MKFFRNTNTQKKYWTERKIDWKAHYLDTWNHPHRQLLLWALQSFPWKSLWEAGCGPGPNLIKIASVMKDRQIGGSDINADAIELARKTFTGGRFHVEPIEDMLLSDDSTDVVLTDAALIYYSPKDIDKAVHEITRIARNHIVLCEFHSKSWWQRKLLKWKTGYNAYNYETLLEKHGCWDIKIMDIPDEYWEGYPWQPYGHIIIARVGKI